MNGSGDDESDVLVTWNAALEMTMPKPPKPNNVQSKQQNASGNSDGIGTWKKALEMTMPKLNNVQSKQQNAKGKPKKLFASNAPKNDQLQYSSSWSVNQSQASNIREVFEDNMNSSEANDSDGQETWEKAVEMTKPKRTSVQRKQQNARGKSTKLFASNAPKNDQIQSSSSSSSSSYVNQSQASNIRVVFEDNIDEEVEDNDDNDGDEDDDNIDLEDNNDDDAESLDTVAEATAEDDQLQNLLKAIKKSDTPPMNEVEKLFKFSTITNVSSNHHCLLVAYAGSTISRGKTKDSEELADNMYPEFLLLYHSAPLMSSWKDKFFPLLPAEHNGGWPDSFKSTLAIQ